MDVLSLGLGSLVLGIGLHEVMSARSVRRLEDQRRKAPPLAEVVPYRVLLRDGVMRLVGDRLQVTWKVTGGDCTAAARGRYAAYLDDVHRALAQRDDADFEYDRWCLNISTFLEESSGYIDSPEPGDPTTATLAWARRRRYEKRGRTFTTDGPYFTATYSPPAAVVALLTRFAVEGDERAADELEREGEAAFAGFERQLVGVGEALAQAFPSVQLLRGIPKTDEHGFSYVEDEQLRFLARCVTGIDEPVVRPPLQLIASVIASENYETGFEPRVGRRFVKVVVIEDFPERSFPGDLDFLADLRIEHRHETFVRFVSSAQAERRYEDARQEAETLSIPLSMRIRGLSPGDAGVPVNPALQRNAEQAVRKMGEVTDGEVRSVLWKSAVILMDEDLDRVRRAARKVAQRVGRRGFKARIEDLNAWEAAVGFWPGDEDHDVPDQMLDSVNLVDFAQLSTTSDGPLYHPNGQLPARSPVLAKVLTHGAKAIRIVDSVDDVMHALVMGDTGASKSTTVLLMAAWGQAQYGEDTFIFDQGGSAERWGSAVNGSYSPCDPASRRGFAFFEGIEDEAVRVDRASILSRTFDAWGIPVSPARYDKIWKSLGIMARSSRRSMSLYQAKLGTFDPDLAKCLEFYTVSGPMGYLIDCETDHSSDARVQVFDLQRLMALKDERAVAPVLMLLFAKMRTRLNDPNAKGRIIIDEPKDYFRLPALAQAFEEELDKARKRRTGVTMTCLRPSDMLKWSIGSTVATSCKTHLVYGMPAAQPPGDGLDAGTEFASFGALGYSDEECVKISSLPKFRALMRQQDSTGARSLIVNLDPDPVELLFVGKNDKDARAETERLRLQFPDTFPAELLRAHGFDEAAGYWMEQAARLGWRFRGEVSDVVA